jgi:hypothetical protein
MGALPVPDARKREGTMKYFATAMLAFGTMLAALLAARAADTTCNGTITGGTVNGNVVVLSGGTCTLLGVMVTGNVQVQSGAVFQAFANGTQGVTIGGNVKVVDGCTIVDLEMTTVGGNVDVQRCGELVVDMNSEVDGNLYCTDSVPTASGGCEIFNSKVYGNVHLNGSTANGGSAVNDTIGSNLQINNNNGATAANNTINGNLQMNTNTEAHLVNNTIDGNLRCDGNTTITGSGNTVDGHKLGQCAGF